MLQKRPELPTSAVNEKNNFDLYSRRTEFLIMAEESAEMATNYSPGLLNILKLRSTVTHASLYPRAIVKNLCRNPQSNRDFYRDDTEAEEELE